MIHFKQPFLVLVIVSTILSANEAPAQKNQRTPTVAETEKEIKAFYDSYAEDLRKHSREAISNRYDTLGYYRMGNGNKSFISFEEVKKHYLTNWIGPKSFEWKDMSIDVISPEAVVVTALFNWESGTGEKRTTSYTGVLKKELNKWKIRVEDESFNSLGYSVKPISGDRSAAGPVKYMLTAQPGASIPAHFHSSEMHVKVVSGRKYILMGDLDSTKAQRFDAGNSFVIPANTWHVEWWEEETVEEIDITAPSKTVRATPATPRN
jgi:ketosteroid isomerase-like protein